MPKPEIGRVASIVKDPMLTMDFIWEIPNIPTGGQDEEPLMILTQQVVKPGFTIENVEVQVFGHTLEFAGRHTYSHDLTWNVYERRDGIMMRMIEKWGEICKSHVDQHGGYKNDYARDAKLTIMDSKRNNVLIYKIVGIWPSSLPDVQLSGNESNAVMHGIGMKYDWWEKTGGSTS